jgi:FimV-like protein
MSFSSLESGNMSWTRKPAFLFLSLTFILVFLMNSCANLRDVRDPAEIAEDPATVFEDPFEESADAYDRMSAAILLGDPESAIQAYEDARLANPDEPETLVLLANLYIAAGDTDGARSLLDEIIAGADGQALVDARLALSLIARIDGNDEEELAQLSAVLDEQPDNPRANAALGEILLEREEYDEAEERFLKALESEPDDYFALQGLGNAYLRNGKSQAAIQVFSGAIEAEPDYSYTYTDRAKAYNEQGLYDQALEDMDRAISLDDENGWHYLDRGRMRARRGLFREAEADFTLAVERTPDNFLAYAYRAQVRGYMGEYDGAAEDYYQVLDARPDYYPAYAFLGALEYIRGNYRSSYGLLADAFDAEPDKPAYVLFAAAALLADDPLEGRRFLEGNLNLLERGSLLYITGRYYIDNVDLPVLNAIRTEENDRIKALGQFYLGLRYQQQELYGTARALFDSAEQSYLDGSPEGLVRQWLVDESS